MTDDIKVVPMPVRQNVSAISILEDALEMAKEGDIEAVSIAYVTKDGSLGGDVSSGRDKFYLLLAMRYVFQYFEKSVFRELQGEQV